MKQLMMVLATFGLVGVCSLTPISVSATACTGTVCIKEGSGSAKTGSDKSDTIPEVVKLITNILLFFIGAVAVIYIVIGGIKYVTSNGDSNHIKSAKDTIMYAVIGLVAAIAAYAIVDFVSKNL